MKQALTIIIILILSIYIVGCSHLIITRNHNPYQSQDYQKYQDYLNEKEIQIKYTAAQELGYDLQKPLTPAQQEKLIMRLNLKNLENSLVTNEEKNQYFANRSLMTEQECVNFLSLPTTQKRQIWLERNKITQRQDMVTEEISNIIAKNDITLGMTQQQVNASWGEPDAIDSAGNRIYKNERWSFNKYVIGKDGYQKEIRIVYFEAGKVIGWETLKK